MDDRLFPLGWVLCLVLLTCTKDTLPTYPLAYKTLGIVNTSDAGRGIMFPPYDMGHERIIYTPISYYAPFTDNTQVPLRVLVLNTYDPTFGMAQVTSLNISGCDSMIADGNTLTFYSDDYSSIRAFNVPEGQYPNAPYTDSSVVMLLFADTTIINLPIVQYTSESLKVPQKPIIGFYYLITDYAVH